MALQINATDEQNNACPAAYVVVDQLIYSKGDGIVHAAASTYKHKAGRDAGLPPIGQTHFRFTYAEVGPGGSIVAQGYTALKLLGSMAGGVDV